MIRNGCKLLLAMGLAGTTYAQQPALKGIELSDLDRKVEPCNDFYEFSNACSANPSAI